MTEYCGDCEHRDGWMCSFINRLLSLETDDFLTEGDFIRHEQCPFNALAGYAIPVMSLEEQNAHLREENHRLRELVKRGVELDRTYVGTLVETFASDCLEEVEKWEKE